MSGIYIHVPFCKQKCHYCNFHFSVSQKNRDALVEAILHEIEMNRNYLPGHAIDTLYFGGGTPSVLNRYDLQRIVDKIGEYFEFKPDIELTLEANPDDLTRKFLDELLEIGVNRLSVGIQSFIDSELELMNRSHDAHQAKLALQNIKQAGFSDFSIDLIFGMPGSTLADWQFNLEHSMEYGSPHFSCYNLTVEEKTAFHHFVRTGKVTPLSDEKMAQQFILTMEFMESHGYEHYEISNYALPGKYARHNTAYWQGKPYLGIGPSAHSYDGRSRQWNIANNPAYIKSIESGKIPFEKEFLEASDIYNEYILTGMRTKWGCSLRRIAETGDQFVNHFNELIKEPIKEGLVVEKKGIYSLTNEGKLFADEISSNLFWE